MLSSQTTFEAARAQVSYAYEHVRFFRKHMERAGLGPSDIVTPADFRRIPTTTKVHYRKNFPAGVLVKGKSLNGRFVYQSTSSGTGGERLITVTHTYMLAQRMERTISVHPPLAAFLLSRPRRKTCRYAAPNCSDVECATPHSTPADRTLADGTLVLPVYHDLLATTENMVRQAIQELFDYQPDWLYIDPTHLAFLIRHMRKQDLAPPPVGAIAMTYSQCTRVARRQIESFFAAGLPIANVISMSEFGWIGMECPEQTIHLDNRSFLVELLVGERPAEPGQMGELVLTSIGDRLSPHIRYRTGDHYTLLEDACACGHDHVAVRYEGRGAGFLTRGGQLSMTPRALDSLVGDAPWMELYKMEQVAEDEFVFRYVPSERFEPAAADELARELRAALGPRATLHIENTHYISGERSGKFISCRSAVPIAGPGVGPGMASVATR